MPSPAAEAAAADDVELLIGQPNENLGRVVDLFHLWDDDDSGDKESESMKTTLCIRQLPFEISDTDEEN